MGRGVDWAVQDVAQLRQWLEEGRKPREMRAMRPDWSLESIKSKLKQLRRGAPDESRPLKRRRTSARLGTDTSSWWWQEDNAPSHTSRRTKTFLNEREIQFLTWPPCSPDLSPLDFHLWQEWETALGERQFTSQLELRAMIVRTVSCLDPEAAEKARTTAFIRRCLACVRAKGGHFEHRL